MFPTLEVSSGEFSLLHGQVDETSAGKAEDMDGVSSVWAPGSPILVVAEAHSSF